MEDHMIRGILFCLVVLSLVSGCIPKTPKPGSPEWDSMATRFYERDPKAVYGAVQTVFQLWSAEIKTTDSGGGMLIGITHGAALNREYAAVVSSKDQGSRLQVTITTVGGSNRHLETYDLRYTDFFSAVETQLAK
jgi:hypothetical protein